MSRNPVYRLLKYYVAGVVLFFAALILWANACNGQELKKHIAPAALVFVSGAFEGVMDHLDHHYDKPDQFWNPDISWTNKYKNHDPAQGKTFAGKYLVFTTDGWHLMKFGRNLTMFAGFTVKVVTDEKKKWYWYLIEGAAYWAVNRAGFNLMYGVILK